MSEVERALRDTIKKGHPGITDVELDAFIASMREEHAEAMEDPENVDLDAHVHQTKVLSLIALLWAGNPSQRLMQLLFNSGVFVQTAAGYVADPFYLRDEELIKILESAIESAKRSGGCRHGGVFRGEQCPQCGEMV